jgi:anti-sigma regulatory factor (Ser/Thr protein kinase)
MPEAESYTRPETWELPFVAEAVEVAQLRQVLGSRLELWGLSQVFDTAALCVSELVTNVIRHVGEGSPATLVMSMEGTYLRIGVRDSDTRTLPTLLSVEQEEESGRGLVLVEALSAGWGVVLCRDSKLVWCDLPIQLTTSGGRIQDPRVARANAFAALYAGEMRKPTGVSSRPVAVRVQEDTVIDLIADLLHWLHAHGCDPDDVLDRAQMHFEAEVEERRVNEGACR